MHVDEYRTLPGVAEPAKSASDRRSAPESGTCDHLAVSEISIGGVITRRSCVDCGTPLPDRDWEPGEEWEVSR